MNSGRPRIPIETSATINSVDSEQHEFEKIQRAKELQEEEDYHRFNYEPLLYGMEEHLTYNGH